MSLHAAPHDTGFISVEWIEPGRQATTIDVIHHMLELVE